MTFTTMPVIVERRIAAATAEEDLTVPENLRYLRGHFPNAPIVPGVVQIKWAIERGAACFEIDESIIALDAVKFTRIICPNDKVTLSLRFEPASHRLHFSYHSAEGVHSSGRLVVGAP